MSYTRRQLDTRIVDHIFLSSQLPLLLPSYSSRTVAPTSRRSTSKLSNTVLKKKGTPLGSRRFYDGSLLEGSSRKKYELE